MISIISLPLLSYFCFIADVADVESSIPSKTSQETSTIRKGLKGTCLHEDNQVPTKFIGLDYKGDGVYIPLIGAGTWQYNISTAYESICKSFDAGYTFVDTAYGYYNQIGVGNAIKDCWNGNRSDLFVMTKIPGGLNSSQVRQLHKQNLEELGLDYVNHLMVHFPSDWNETNTGAKVRQEEWLALEEIYYTGEARTIGIRHYCTKHIMDIMQVATVTPAINQVEYHVGSGDVDNVMGTCNEFGITFMSFSPLCGPCTYDPADSLINGNLVTEIAKNYTHGYYDIKNSGSSNVVTGSQVALHYIVQQGIPVIPKSNTMSHIIANKQIFDFELSTEHMDRLMKATKPSAEAGDCDVVLGESTHVLEK